MDFSNVLILIPARMQSTRFPGKPLAAISGKPMIRWVYENLKALGSDVWVVTDHEDIEQEVQKFGQVCRIDEPVSTGSERIYLAYKKYFQGQSSKKYDFIVNVQGDEPLLAPDALKKLLEFQWQKSYEVATLLSQEQKNLEDFQHPNTVKVIFSPETGECHYFSRAPIPFQRDQGEVPDWYKHIGVYSFKPKALEAFHQFSGKCLFEDSEKLEQLRFLELGYKIGATITDLPLQAVDHPTDIQKVERILSEKKY